MLGLAGTVLLIVCLNISGMMLVRGATRERELSIRAALGAGRRSLIGYLFFEAVLLAFAAGTISALVLFGIPAVIGWRVRTAELSFQTDGLAAARLPATAGPEREAGFAIRKVRDDLKQTAGVGQSRPVSARITIMMRISPPRPPPTRGPPA